MSEIRVKSTGTIKLFESDNTSHVTIASPASLSANRTITIPDADVTLGAGVSLTGSTNNQVTTVTGANAITGEAKLTFDGSVLNNVQSAGAASEIKASAASVYTKVIADDASGFSAIDYSHDLRFKDAGTEKMRIASTGKVGIGETSPLGQLHVKTADSGVTSPDTGADDVFIENNNHAGISICTPNNKIGRVFFADPDDSDVGYINYDHSSNLLEVGVNAGTRMTIDNAGRVNINTASAITGEGVLQVKGNSSQNVSAFQVATNGNVAIRFFNSSTSGVGSITVNSSSTSYGTSSDYRLKENEVDISDGIERLKQLKPYKFNFKTEPDTTVDGFFAHEVSSIVPEAISGEKDAMIPEVLYTADDELPEGKNIGDVKEATKIDAQSIDQSKLVPLLTKALQEAITKIETLEAKVTALENA